MVAAITPLPVIGVPVRGSSLDGVDSLLSIVQVHFAVVFTYSMLIFCAPHNFF